MYLDVFPGEREESSDERVFFRGECLLEDVVQIN